MQTDRDFRSELDALDETPTVRDDTAPAPAWPTSGPISETRRAVEPMIDRFTIKKQIEDEEKREAARQGSSPLWQEAQNLIVAGPAAYLAGKVFGRGDGGEGALGTIGKLNDAERQQWIADEKVSAERSASFWEDLRKNYGDALKRSLGNVIDYSPQGLIAQQALKRTGVIGEDTALGDEFGGWFDRKVGENIALAKRRRLLAEEMEAGVRAGPKFGTVRSTIDDISRGFSGIIGKGVKGVAYGIESGDLIKVNPLVDGYIVDTLKKAKVISGNPSEAQKRSIYQFGQYIEHQAEQLFPADEARAEEFRKKLAEGVGSMIAFMGAGYTAVALGKGAGVATIVSGITGGLSQAGSMTDDALKKYLKDAQTEGRKLTPEEERKATQVWLMGLGIGATEAIPLASFFAGHSGRFVRGVLLQATEEGGQEWVQQVLENVVAQRYYDPERKWDDNAWEGLAIGAILGSNMQAGQAGLSKLRGEKEKPAEKPPAVKPITPEGPAPEVLPMADVSPMLDGEGDGKKPSVRKGKSADPELDRLRQILSPSTVEDERPTEIRRVLGKGLEELASDGGPGDAIAKVAGVVSKKLETGQVPTFQELLGALPKDERGDPDMGRLADELDKVGVRAWNGLNDDQRRQVYEAVAPVVQAVEGNPEAVAEAVRQVVGEAPAETKPKPAKPNRVVTPDGSFEFEATPEIVDLADLRLASGDMQPRDRTRQESDAGVVARAAALDPSRLMPGRVSDSGAPIVAPDGTIISGNGRVMSIAQVYDTPALAERAKAYRDALGPAAEGMEKPVLVQRLPAGMSRDDLVRLADLSSRSSMAGLSASERAVRDARAAGPDIMTLYTGGSFLSPANQEFFRAFVGQVVTDAERPNISRNGVLSKEGEDRMSAAVLASAYGDSDLLSRMLESLDDNIRNVTGALRDAAGAFIRLKAAIASGEASAQFDITPQIVETARRIADLRDRNIKPDVFLAQQDAFNQVDPLVESLIRAFYNDGLSRPLSREKLTELLTRYANEAEKHQDGGLIPDETKPDDVIRFARDRALADDRAAAGQGNLFGNRPRTDGGTDAGAGRAAERPGDRGRGQPAREVGPVVTDAHRAKFNAVLNSKAKRSEWAKAAGVNKAQLDALVNEALSDGRLKKTKAGGIARTGKKVEVKSAPKAATPTRAQIREQIDHLDKRIENARASLSIGRPTPEDIARTDDLIRDLEAQKASLRASGQTTGQPSPESSSVPTLSPGQQTGRTMDRSAEKRLEAVKSDVARAYAQQLLEAPAADYSAIVSKLSKDKKAPVAVVHEVATVVTGSKGKTKQDSLNKLAEAKPAVEVAPEPVAAAEPVAAPAPQPEVPTAQAAVEAFIEKKSRIEDAGQKIGGARKDMWAERGIALADLEGMSNGEQAKYVNKDGVWPKPDYAALVEAGMPPVVAATLKLIRDGLSARPRYDTPDGRRAYVEMMGWVRSEFEKVRSVEDFSKARDRVVYELVGWPRGTFERGTAEQSAKLFSIFKGRKEALRPDRNMVRKAQQMVSAGFPGDVEPWTRRFDVKLWPRPNQPENYTVLNKQGRMQSEHPTEAEAKAAAKALYEAQKETDADEGKLPERPHLDNLSRTGADIRGGRDVDSNDFVKDFGFRGVEFGNWVAGDERQKVVNLAYDAMHDLANVLGIPVRALSLNGTLGLAFGARGSGRFAAHYEPAKLVINMTKIRGAGSLAHEWAHALDHYFGELGRTDAYQGDARGASGWYDQAKSYSGQPITRYDRQRGTVSEMRLSSIRPEMSAAFDGVMDALYKRDRTQADVVRDRELALERARGNVTTTEQRLKTFEASDPKSQERNAKYGESLREYLKGAKDRVALLEKALTEARGPDFKPSGKVDSSFYTQAKALSGKQGEKGYWARPTEMFARSLESYVFDKIAEGGAQSDYLVQGVEPERYAGSEYKGNPYPAGPERDAINAAYERLFDTMESTPEGALYALSPQMHAITEDLARKAVRSALKLGKAVRLNDDTRTALQAAMARMPNILPSDTTTGFLVEVRPLKSGNIRAFFETADGSLVHFDGTADDFLGSRAFFVKAKDGPAIFHVRFSTPGEDGVASLTSERWHEAVHALRAAEALTGPTWDLLLSHANSLRILEMSWKSYLQAAGDPAAENANRNATLIELYYTTYSKRMTKAQLQEALDQEAVAIMTELLVRGVDLPLPENIRSILAGIERGEFAGNREIDVNAGEMPVLAALNSYRVGRNVAEPERLWFWQKPPKSGTVLMFHATNRDFDRFDLGKASDFGIHFGTAEQAWGRITRTSRESGSRTIPAEITLKNAIVMDDVGYWGGIEVLDQLQQRGFQVSDAERGEMRELQSRIDYWDAKGVSANRTAALRAAVNEVNELLKQKLNSLGIDGIWYRNTEEGKGWSLVVWNEGRVANALSRQMMMALGGTISPADFAAPQQAARQALAQASAAIANDEANVAFRSKTLQVAGFVQDWVVPSEGQTVTTTSLYEAYSEWVEALKGEPVPLPTFTSALNDLGLTKQKIAGRVRYIGVNVLPADQRPAPTSATASRPDVSQANAQEIAAEVRKGSSIVDAIKGLISRLTALVRSKTDPAAAERLVHARALEKAVANENDPNGRIIKNVVPLFALGGGTIFSKETQEAKTLSRHFGATRIEDIGPNDPHPGRVLAFHGTGADFDVLDVGRSNDFGVHFGTAGQANSKVGYADDGEVNSGGRILPAVLDLKSVVTMNDFGSWDPVEVASEVEARVPVATGIEATVKTAATVSRKAAYNALADGLTAAGIDGIRYSNGTYAEGPGWSYIVWEPGKVISATSGNMLFALGGSVSNDADIDSSTGQSMRRDLDAVLPADWRPPWHRDRDVKELDALAKKIDPDGTYFDRATTWAVRNHIRGDFQNFRALLSSDGPTHSIEEYSPNKFALRGPASFSTKRSREEAEAALAEALANGDTQRIALRHAGRRLLAYAESKNPDHKKAITYRWVGHDSYDKLKVGDTFTDPAFMSTKTGVRTSDIDPREANATAVLRVNSWSGLDIEKSPFIQDTSLNSGEREVLLPPGRTFTVTAAERNAKGFLVIDLDETVPSEGQMMFALGSVKRSVMEDGQPMFALGGFRPDPEPAGEGSLDKVIQDLKDTLGVVPTQTLMGVTIRAEDGKEVRLNPQSNVRGQTTSATGAVGVRKSRDVAAIAHESAHYLETTLGSEILDLQTMHAVELAAINPAASPSEQWAEWFAEYLMDPTTASIRAPLLHSSVEDVLEANGMLDGIHDVQASYQEWKDRATPEQLSSDVVSVYAGNSFADLKPDGVMETLPAKMAQFYTAAIDSLNPLNKMVKKLLQTADRNGVTDAEGRPISLKVADNPYKLARMFAGSFATGHSWLTRGIANRGETSVAFAPLTKALEVLYGSNKGSDWQSTQGKAMYQTAGQYLISQRAIVEYDLLEKKETRLEEIDGILEQGQSAWRETSLARQEDQAVLARREDALIRSQARLSDRKRALASAESTLSNLQERIQAKKDDVTAALMARDQALADRRQRDLQILERDSRIALRNAEAMIEEVQKLDVDVGLLSAEIEQLQTGIDGHNDRMGEVEEAIAQLRREREATAKRGGSAKPTAESKEWHQDFITKVEADPKYARITEFADLVREFTHGLLTIRHQAGLISDEQFDLLSKRKDYYTPFQRDMTDASAEDVFFKGLGMTKKWSPFKKYDGSDRAIVNPLEVLSQQAYSVAQQIMFNDAVGALSDLGVQAGPGGASIVETMTREESAEANAATFERIRSIAMSMGIDEADANDIVSQMEMNFANQELQFIWSPATKGPIQLPTLPLYRDGERIMVRLTDPEFGAETFNALNGMGKEMSDFWINVAARPARWLQVGVTTHPTFMPRNLFRDIWDAWIKTGAAPIFTQIEGAKQLYRNGDFLRQYSEAGGIMGGRNIAALTAKEQQTKVLELADKSFAKASAALGGIAGGLTGTVIGGPVGTAVGAALGATLGGKFNFLPVVEAVESMTRLGVASYAYKRAKEHNPDLTDTEAMLEAAFTARDVFDWNRRGSKMLTMLRLVTFLNAQIQGMDAASRRLGGDNDRGSALAKQLGIVWRRENGVKLSADEERALGDAYKTMVRMSLYTGLLTALYLLATSGDDDDKDKKYQDIRDRTKFTHSWLPDVFGTSLRLPKAFEWAVPANMIEALADKIRGRDPRLAERLTMGVYEVLVPPGVPQVLNLVMGVGANVDIRSLNPFAAEGNREIVGDSLQRLDPEAQFDAFSSQLSIDFAKALAAIGIPRDMVPSPKKIDFILRTGGYWGQDIAKGYGILREGFGGRPREEPRVSDFPVIGGFTGVAARQSRSRDELFKLMNRSGGKLSTAANTYKDYLDQQGVPDEAARYLANLEPEERAYAILKYHGTPSATRDHPLERLIAIDGAANKLRKDMILDRLTPIRRQGRRQVRDFEEKISLNPRKQTEIHDILERLMQAEAWNTMVLMKRPGWEGRKEFAVQPILDELKASSPEVFDLYEDRLQKTRARSFDDVKQEWPQLRERILREGPGAF